jgi:hypothetical protein
MVRITGEVPNRHLPSVALTSHGCYRIQTSPKPNCTQNRIILPVPPTFPKSPRAAEANDDNPYLTIPKLQVVIVTPEVRSTGKKDWSWRNTVYVEGFKPTTYKNNNSEFYYLPKDVQSRNVALFCAAYGALQQCKREFIRIDAYAWYVLRHLDPKLRPAKYRDFNALTFIRENNIHVVNRFPVSKGVQVKTPQSVVPEHPSWFRSTSRTGFVGGVSAAFYPKLRGSAKYLVRRPHK